VAFLAAIIILWETVFRLGIWPDFMFPGPLQVVQTLIRGFSEGNYVPALLNSLRRLFIGYFFAVVLGMIIGVLMGRFKSLEETLGTVILPLQSVPSVVWLPLALLWFSMGESAMIFVVVIGGLWNMIMSTTAGIKGVDPVLIQCGRNLGFGGGKIFTKVILPAAIPSMITGMRLAWAFCWRALMAAEIIGTGQGLGQVLMWGRDMGNMSTVMAVMFIIAATGMISDGFVFKRLEDKVYRQWGLM